MPSRLNPYLSFDGKAREAMDFYHDVFGGEMTAQTFAEGGMSQGPDDADLIMHAQLEAAERHDADGLRHAAEHAVPAAGWRQHLAERG